MSRTPPGPPAPPHGEAVTAFCAATYQAEVRDRYCFTFLVAQTNTRFTIYACHPDRYKVGRSYALILAAPDAVPVPLDVEDVEFLRHCLTNTAHRWWEALTEADAGAERPPADQADVPGYLNVEPTPSGYRAAGRLFRDELTRVEQLAARLGEILAATRTQQQEEEEEEP